MKKSIPSIYRITIIVLLSFQCINTYAIKVEKSKHQIKVYSNDVGFFQNTILDICSDQTGDLWFATVNGLIRYDGYKFFNYSSTETLNSIQNNFVKAIYSDKKGHIWIANSGGLCVYNTNNEEFSLIVSNTEPTAISESPDSCIWVCTAKRIDIYHPNQIFQAKRRISLADYCNNNINSIHIISNTQCIVSTEQQIFMVDIISEIDFKVTLLEPLDFELPWVYDVETDGNFLWLGTESSIMQCSFDRGKLILVRNFQLNEILGVNDPVKVKSIYIDREDKIWIGTQNEGILEFDRPSNTFFTYPNSNNKGLSSPNINCFYEDKYKSIWIGTAQGGVNQIDKTEKPFFSITNEPHNTKSLSGHLVNCILEDDEGYIWSSFSNFTISRSTAPLSTYSNLEFESVRDKNNTLKNKDIMYIFQDYRGWLWLCDLNSIYLYDEKHDKFCHLSININGVPSNISRIRNIVQLNNETFLLAGSSLAIIKNPWPSAVQNKAIEVSDIQFFEQDCTAEDLVIDEKGNYWVATSKGLKSFRIEAGNISFNDFTALCQEEDKELMSTQMLCIHYSDIGLWIGTFGKGLIKVNFNNNGQISHLNHLNESKGLSDDMVYGILEDEKNNLWISTDMGISKFNTATESFDIFDINDGMLHNNFRRYAYLKTGSNTFIYGGLNGLTFFNPKDIEKKQSPPDVKISQIRIDNKKINSGTLVNGKKVLLKYDSQTQKLTVYPTNKSLHIEVLTQHSATPIKNRVAYRFDGVDDDWVITDEGKTTVNYTGLRPGNYIFRYKGANGDGLWTEGVKTLDIRVLSPWYFKWWSILLEVFLITAIITAIMTYSLRMQKLKNNLIFERNDKARIKEIDEAKLRLFTNISHEFITPLSLIMAPLEKMTDSNVNDLNKHYISLIKSNVKRLQRLIQQLVSFRKHDQGKLKIHYSRTSLGDFVYPLIESFEEIIASKNIIFIHKVEHAEREIVIDTEKSELILFNLLSNAVKYTKSGGQIEFNALFSNNNSGMLTFAVIDNGIGILPENISLIFDRFYRTERSGSQSGGFGIGLAFSKSMLDALNGALDVSSEPNSFTKFEVLLPYQNTPEEVLEKSSEVILSEQEFPNFKKTDQSGIDFGATILIIDDEIDFRNFLQHSLSMNYNVVLAENGEDGLEKLQLISPQLIICDVMMEGMSGFEVCEKIKSDTDTCHIPLILLTALPAEDHEFKSVELGADYYVQKPFSMQFLELKVKQLIEDRKKLQEHYSKQSYLPDEGMSIPVRDRKFLEKINEAIEENISDSSFGLSELASSVGYSVSHFSRRLKELTGQVPSLYVRNYRLQRAAEMLSSYVGINTKEVMYDVGISSASYFSASFKKVYGLAPSVYRDTIHEKNEKETSV